MVGAAGCAKCVLSFLLLLLCKKRNPRAQTRSEAATRASSTQGSLYAGITPTAQTCLLRSARLPPGQGPQALNRHSGQTLCSGKFSADSRDRKILAEKFDGFETAANERWKPNKLFPSVSRSKSVSKNLFLRTSYSFGGRPGHHMWLPARHRRLATLSCRSSRAAACTMSRFTHGQPQKPYPLALATRGI